MIVGTWNINNVRNKLEDEKVLSWLQMHDFIVLVEIKISKLPHVPGFIPVMAKTLNSRRGGVALLVKVVCIQTCAMLIILQMTKYGSVFLQFLVFVLVVYT